MCKRVGVRVNETVVANAKYNSISTVGFEVPVLLIIIVNLEKKLTVELCSVTNNTQAVSILEIVKKSLGIVIIKVS